MIIHGLPPPLGATLWLATLALLVPGMQGFIPLGGLSCITCTDGCDMPREPAYNVMTELCSEDNEQAPICVSYFDPDNVRYNLGRGCMRAADLPANFRESECMMVDVSDFWDRTGTRKNTCVCFCTFDACNYEPLCYGFGEFGDGSESANASMSTSGAAGAPRRPWTAASMLFAIAVITVVMSC